MNIAYCDLLCEVFDLGGLSRVNNVATLLKSVEKLHCNFIVDTTVMTEKLNTELKTIVETSLERLKV